jgi:hypothetical protein
MIPAQASSFAATRIKSHAPHLCSVGVLQSRAA